MEQVFDALMTYSEGGEVKARCSKCNHPLVVTDSREMGSRWVTCDSGCTSYHEKYKPSASSCSVIANPTHNYTLPDDIETKINELLADPGFLELVNLQNRPILFSTLAASHTEMWHSAFVKWLIDPASHLGLGNFPLKRFLFAVMHVGRTSPSTRKPELDLGELEDMVLDNIEFETEFSFHQLGNKRRIDIIGVLEEVPLVTRQRETTSVRIIIENKITAMEGKDQTGTYYEFAKRSSEDFQYDFFIFLTPDESQMPSCDQFIQLTYQDLCDLIIRPCLTHPALPEESKYILQQYLLNLRNPIRGGRVMALANKELCERIYLAYKEVLDEIFVSVRGMAP